MALLIDGYNLLFAAGMMPRHVGPGTLRRARRALQNYLLAQLTADEIRQTVVVFDAKDAPRDLPEEEDYQGLRILFARDHEEADDLIEQLIRHESVPRQLCVVTSDLRLRTAAQRRRCRAVKSEDWLDQIERQPRRTSPDAVASPKSAWQRHAKSEMDDTELQAWLEAFGLESDEPGDNDVTTASSASQADQTVDAEDPPRVAQQPAPERDGGPDGSDELDDWGPFPRGYGEDLLNDPDQA